MDVASETGRIDVTKGIVEKNHCHLFVNVPHYVSRLYDPRFCLLLVTFSRFCCSLVSFVSSNWKAAIFRPDLLIRMGRLWVDCGLLLIDNGSSGSSFSVLSRGSTVKIKTCIQNVFI